MANEEFLTGNTRGLDVGDGKGAALEVVVGFTDGTGAFVRTSSSNAIPVSGLGSAVLNIASSVAPTGGLTVTVGQATVASAVGASLDTGTVIVGASSGRNRVTITNFSNGTLFVGSASGVGTGVTASSVWHVIPGNTVQAFNTGAAFWGIASSGANQVSFLTEAP